MLNELIGAIPSNPEGVGVLGAAKYVVSSRLRRAKLKREVAEALRRLDEVLQRAPVLEPTAEEQRYAAELEASSQRGNLPLDTGESQLCAIVMARAIPSLVTGDKRAIAALERLLIERHEVNKFSKKVLCLEQLFERLLCAGDGKNVRLAVCAEASIDKALAACFSCYSAESNRESWLEGLASYIRDVRGTAPHLLAE